MEKTNSDAEIDALIAELTGLATRAGEEDAEYPLPESKPVKYTNVDVLVMPHGYKYPKPSEESISMDSLPLQLDLDSLSETDGVLSVPVIAAKEMVYDYDGLKALKPFDELKAAALFANGIPITREHPKSGIVTDRREVLGFFRDPVAEDGQLKGILEIADRDLIADVKGKKLSEVSSGFFCALDRSSGEFNGNQYDAVQRNIFLNHIAVVEHGRCSLAQGCGINLDAYAYPMPPDVIDKLDAAIERAKAMKDKSLLELLRKIRKVITTKKGKDSLDSDAFNLVKVRDAIAQLKASAAQSAAERDELQTKLEEIVKAEKDAIITELEELQHAKQRPDLETMTLDDLKKELDMVKELKASKIAVPGLKATGGRHSIDEAYAKIGGK
jgi:hypothetical protein